MRLTRVLFLALLALLLLPALALAQEAGTIDPKPSPTLVLPTDQLWVYLAASLVTLPTYLFNHYGPVVSEPVKGLVLMVTAGVAGGITQAVTAGGVGFNHTTLQFIVTAVVGAFLTHKFVWQTTGISSKLGAGTNKPGQPNPGPPPADL